MEQIKIKLLEVIIDGKPYAWVASKDVKLTLSDASNTVTIVTKHAEHGKITTTVDLYKSAITTIG